MKKEFLAVAAFAGMMAASVAAYAAPTLSFRAYENGSLQALTGTSTTGSLFVGGATTSFSVVSGVANGAPSISSPDFAVNNTAISSQTNFSGPVTLRLEFTQTDVSSADAGGLFASFANSLTANLLVSSPAITSVTISNYANADNAAFGTSTLLATQTFTTPGANASPTIIGNVALPNSLFSETVVIEAVFTAGGAMLQSNSQMAAVPVPAPGSLALFGAALLGLGMVSTRRKS